MEKSAGDAGRVSEGKRFRAGGPGEVGEDRAAIRSQKQPFFLRPDEKIPDWKHAEPASH
jgi:hypothetical protein